MVGCRSQGDRVQAPGRGKEPPVGRHTNNFLFRDGVWRVVTGGKIGGDGNGKWPMAVSMTMTKRPAHNNLLWQTGIRVLLAVVR